MMPILFWTMWAVLVAQMLIAVGRWWCGKPPVAKAITLGEVREEVRDLIKEQDHYQAATKTGIWGEVNLLQGQALGLRDRCAQMGAAIEDVNRDGDEALEDIEALAVVVSVVCEHAQVQEDFREPKPGEVEAFARMQHILEEREGHAVLRRVQAEMQRMADAEKDKPEGAR